LTITNNLLMAPRLLAFENSIPTANASTHLCPTIFVYKKKITQCKKHSNECCLIFSDP
jgi:hypothetical protein